MQTETFVENNDGNAWLQAHEALSRLAKNRALADAEEGRWLLAAVRPAAHVHLGFATFGEYIERLFGYGRRCAQEKLRVAEALETLSELTRALETGEPSWSAIRELTRVAVPETEREWLEVSVARASASSRSSWRESVWAMVRRLPPIRQRAGMCCASRSRPKL